MSEGWKEGSKERSRRHKEREGRQGGVWERMQSTVESCGSVCVEETQKRTGPGGSKAGGSKAWGKQGLCKWLYYKVHTQVMQKKRGE